MATVFDDVKPWPTKAPEAVGSVAGHNRPPVDVEARAAFDEGIDAKDGFRGRIATLIAASERATATDEETAGRCGELVKQIRAAVKFIGDTHTATKAPYLLAGRAIDAGKNELAGPLETAKIKVEAKQTQFLREEEAKRQAELRRQREAEDARRREEWEANQAEIRRLAEISAAEGKVTSESVAVAQAELEAALSPPAPTLAPEPERQIIRGDYGAAVSGTKVWLSQVEDYAVAFAAVANNTKVREAIDTAIKAMVRGGVHEIPGVRIWSDVKASNR
ncbi:hypothetical protein [Sphingomonas sp. PB4P5]|uniref:hypothetical protein n=1 Tax=Parasphingomonas puruogangriensis TaxID=3096155 RepID=UPI002FC76EBA